jgi:hypothetical protein
VGYDRKDPQHSHRRLGSIQGALVNRHCRPQALRVTCQNAIRRLHNLNWSMGCDWVGFHYRRGSRWLRPDNCVLEIQLRIVSEFGSKSGWRMLTADRHRADRRLQRQSVAPKRPLRWRVHARCGLRAAIRVHLGRRRSDHAILAQNPARIATDNLATPPRAPKTAQKQ